jgi:PAS domain S-box-containing protein
MAWSLLPDGAVDFVNQRWLEFTGLSLQEAIEDSVRIVHPEDLARALAKWSPDMAAGRPGDDEMRLRRADGEYRWFLIRTVPLRNEKGHIVRWYGSATDIEDRKRAEEALRGMSRRMVDLQESERRELSRELHDRVGQNLTALKINIAILQPALATLGDDDAVARGADSAALLEATIRTIENVMYDLRPPMLDDFGLAAALDWHARNFSTRTGIAVVVRAGESAARPPPQVEIALFRIAQEALNNIAKHAGARRAAIELDHANGEYVMSVRDDGIGFDSAADAADIPNPGLGMVTMRERSQAVGGRFEIRTLPDRGTQLTVRIPYSADANRPFDIPG